MNKRSISLPFFKSIINLTIFSKTSETSSSSKILTNLVFPTFKFAFFTKIAFFLLLINLNSCYEPEEGCLDLTSTNFDLDADEPCVDCCTYPKLKIRFNNKWQYADTLVAFTTDTFYLDVNNDPFRIERIRFYWSDYQLVLNDGSKIATTDLIDIKVANGADTSTINIVDHFMLADVNSSTDNFTLGSIRPNGILQGLNTNFGIDRPANSAITDDFTSTHVLAPQLGNMNYGSEEGYIFAKIELFKDTTATDTIPYIINVFGDNALRNLTLDLPVPVILTEGFNPLLIIETDFAKWFDGINIRTGDTSTIQTQIVDNIAESFTLKEVLAN